MAEASVLAAAEEVLGNTGLMSVEESETLARSSAGGGGGRGPSDGARCAADAAVVTAAAKLMRRGGQSETDRDAVVLQAAANVMRERHRGMSILGKGKRPSGGVGAPQHITGDAPTLPEAGMAGPFALTSPPGSTDTRGAPYAGGDGGQGRHRGASLLMEHVSPVARQLFEQQGGVVGHVNPPPRFGGGSDGRTASQPPSAGNAASSRISRGGPSAATGPGLLDPHRPNKLFAPPPGVRSASIVERNRYGEGGAADGPSNDVRADPLDPYRKNRLAAPPLGIRSASIVQRHRAGDSAAEAQQEAQSSRQTGMMVPAAVPASGWGVHGTSGGGSSEGRPGPLPPPPAGVRSASVMASDEDNRHRMAAAASAAVSMSPAAVQRAPIYLEPPPTSFVPNDGRGNHGGAPLGHGAPETKTSGVSVRLGSHDAIQGQLQDVVAHSGSDLAQAARTPLVNSFRRSEAPVQVHSIREEAMNKERGEGERKGGKAGRSQAPRSVKSGASGGRAGGSAPKKVEWGQRQVPGRADVGSARKAPRSTKRSAGPVTQVPFVTTTRSNTIIGEHPARGSNVARGSTMRSPPNARLGSEAPVSGAGRSAGRNGAGRNGGGRKAPAVVRQVEQVEQVQQLESIPPPPRDPPPASKSYTGRRMTHATALMPGTSPATKDARAALADVLAAAQAVLGDEDLPASVWRMQDTRLVHNERASPNAAASQYVPSQGGPQGGPQGGYGGEIVSVDDHHGSYGGAPSQNYASQSYAGAPQQHSPPQQHMSYPATSTASSGSIASTVSMSYQPQAAAGGGGGGSGGGGSGGGGGGARKGGARKGGARKEGRAGFDRP